MKARTTSTSNIFCPKRRAFTLTEIAIVLGLIGLILGTIWVAASAVYTNMRVDMTTRGIIAFAQGMRNMYGNQGLMETGANAITVTQLIGAGIVPNDLVNTTGNGLADSWGGTIIFTPATTINLPGDSFVLDLANIPQAACVGLLTDTSAKSTNSGLYGLAAGAAAFTTIAGVGTTTDYPPATAVTDCTATSHVGYAFSIH
jgi:hypothetical protein